MEITEKDIKLYYPNGDPITSIDEFINFYSKCYYIDNNKEVEDVIDNILKNGFENALDVYKVLAWKIGKISMKKSTKEKFVYHKGWDEIKFIIKIYDEIIDAKDFCEKVYILSKEINEGTDPQYIMDKLEEYSNEEYSIGTVYLLTLLYFLTKGKYPIYDKYAYIALNAIKEGKELYSKVKYIEVFNKYTDDYKSIMSVGFYKEYIELLTEIFSDDYLYNRDIDRALWTYGHCFI